MKGELEIEVLWHTDSTRQFEEANLDYNPDDLEHRTMTFYNIDAISPNHWDGEHHFCNIYSGGERWISPYTYSQVKEMINHFHAIEFTLKAKR